MRKLMHPDLYGVCGITTNECCDHPLLAQVAFDLSTTGLYRSVCIHMATFRVRGQCRRCRCTQDVSASACLNSEDALQIVKTHAKHHNADQHHCRSYIMTYSWDTLRIL